MGAGPMTWLDVAGVIVGVYMLSFTAFYLHTWYGLFGRRGGP